jgi:hypothetical protein
LIKEWSAAKVAKSMKIAIPKVYIIKHRITRQLREEIERIREHII